MLDLRSIYYLTGNDHRPPGLSSMSSVHFATGFMGNFAAPLGNDSTGNDSTWNSGPGDDVANDRGNQYEGIVGTFPRRTRYKR